MEKDGEEGIIMRVCTFAIETCYECPFCKYYGESGCRSYTPAHYVCMRDATEEHKFRGKIIAKEWGNKVVFAEIYDLGKDAVDAAPEWSGQIPHWCRLSKVDMKPSDSLVWNRFCL